MSRPFNIACVQTSSGPEIAANLAAVAPMVRQARSDGADLITLPEVVAMIEPDRDRLQTRVAEESRHEALAAFRELARETAAWLLVGSLTVRAPDGRLANRAYLLDEAGAVVARYDKIHMFDIDLPDGESYRESATYAPGERAVVAATPWAQLGLTICYDVRFPELYRALARAGAEVLVVPSAFTRPTGEAHWHVLLRARAIETGCYVVAAAQCGEHAGGRKTFGHSLIVDPWGRVLADAGDKPGIVQARIEPALVEEARRAVPALFHDRRWRPPVH